MTTHAKHFDRGPCDRTKACQRSYGHKGDCVQRQCEREGCTNPTRNAEEHFCVRHESRSTYELYEAAR